MRSVIYSFLSLVAFVCFSLSPLAAANEQKSLELSFRIIPHNLDQWHRFVDGRKLEEIDSFDHPDVSRHMLELYWFARAAQLGGCKCKIDYVTSSYISHARSMTDVNLGHAVSHPVATFDDDPRFERDALYKSEPILRKEWFYVGFFTAEGREEILSLSREQDIRALRVGVVDGWLVDRAIIEGLGYQAFLADGWHALLRMVEAGRVDVLLQPFGVNEDFGFASDELGTRFLPIHNWKAPFPATRSYYVNKEYPGAKSFLDALNKGIKMITENGELLRSYTEAGVINHRTQNWQVLSR